MVYFNFLAVFWPSVPFLEVSSPLKCGKPKIQAMSALQAMGRIHILQGRLPFYSLSNFFLGKVLFILEEKLSSFLDPCFESFSPSVLTLKVSLVTFIFL